MPEALYGAANTDVTLAHFPLPGARRKPQQPALPQVLLALAAAPGPLINDR
jgi:hypothetical protein